MPSLREIEKTVSTLWLNEGACNWLISGATGEFPIQLKQILPKNLATILATIDQKGLQLYGQLINYGHQDVMLSIFPYCAKLIGKNWETIVNDYLLKYPPNHFNLNRLCKHFPEYITVYGGDFLTQYPFLAELADYEWIELEKMEINLDINCMVHRPLSSLEMIASLGPIVNQTLTICAYTYNIPKIVSLLENGRKLGKHLKPRQTFVIAYRQPVTHYACLIDVDAVAAQVIQTAMERSITYQELVSSILPLTKTLAPEAAIFQFLQLVEDLQEKGIFTGSLVVRADKNNGCH